MEHITHVPIPHASGHAETVDRPADDNQFARQQLAEDFNITKIRLEAQSGDLDQL